MAKFNDIHGRSWKVLLNPAGLRRVKWHLGIDLRQLSLDEFGHLVGDTPRLVDVVYVLCRRDAERRGVSDEDFGRSLQGEAALLDACRAFSKEMIELYPDPRVRSVLRTVIREHLGVRS